MQDVTDSLMSASVSSLSSTSDNSDHTIITAPTTQDSSGVEPSTSTMTVPNPLPSQETAVDQLTLWHSEICSFEERLFKESNESIANRLSAAIDTRKEWIRNTMTMSSSSVMEMQHKPMESSSVRTIKEPKIKALSSKDDALNWSFLMEGVIEEYIHSHTIHKVPFTADKLRYFWTKNLPVEEEYTDFLATMKEQDIFEDPAAVMAAFRESFTDDSYASRFNRFMSIVWKPGQAFQVFVNQFRKYAIALDLEDDKMGVRAFLAQRFLLCLPAEYNMSMS